MPTLYIRARDTGDGRRFDVRYRRGGRYSKVEHGGTFRTRKEALIRRALIGEWLAGAKDPKAELQRVVEGGVSFRHVHAEWLASRRSVADSTLAAYRVRGRVLLDRFGDVPVDAITTRDVIAWVGDLTVNYKPGTVRLIVGDLRMVLDFADVPNVARDRKVELPRVVRSEPVPPDKEEVVAILVGVESRYRLPIATMEQLGTRVSETLSLTHADIDESGSVRIPRERTKGQRRGRTIDAPRFLIAALQRSLPFAVGRNEIGAAMRPLGGFSPHSLRHRRASLWHQQGVVASELARRLGHSKPSTSLDIYQSVMPLQEVPPEVLARFLQ
jgi:integrase